MNALSPRLLKWHRTLALIAASAFLLWAGSGLLHPVMTWTNPRPASFAPPEIPEFEIPSTAAIKSALRRNGITAIENLRITAANRIQVTLLGQPERVYIDLGTGKIIPDADSSRALSLARHYSGVPEQPRAITLVTEFSDAYPYINRFLPAWRIDFDRPDGLSLYVETRTDRLGSITDTQKFLLQTIFQNVHTWSFLKRAEGLRIGVVFCLVASSLAMAGLGLALLIALRRSNGVRGQRRWHRWLAVIAWLPFLVFPASGLFHLAVHSPLFYAQAETVPPQLAVNDIPRTPPGMARGISLLLMPGGTPYWWTPAMPVDEAAAALARQFSGKTDILSLTEIKKFSSEYAFANKRLPVWRAEFENGVYFVEPSTATLAAKASRLGTAENLAFSTLHKWQFLEPYIQKTGRDIAMIAAILAGMAMTASGLIIRFKFRK